MSEHLDEVVVGSRRPWTTRSTCACLSDVCWHGSCLQDYFMPEILNQRHSVTGQSSSASCYCAGTSSRSSEVASLSDSGTLAWILLEEASSHTCGTSRSKCFLRWSSPTSYDSSLCADYIHQWSADFCLPSRIPHQPNCRQRRRTVGNNLALLLPLSLVQAFKRFQLAVDQRYAAICAFLAMFMFSYLLMWNQKSSPLRYFFIFTVKINTTHVAINIGSANAPPTPHKIYALHCKEHTPIYMLIMISDANIMLTICKSLVYKVPKSNKSYDSSRVAAVWESPIWCIVIFVVVSEKHPNPLMALRKLKSSTQGQ